MRAGRGSELIDIVVIDIVTHDKAAFKMFDRMANDAAVSAISDRMVVRRSILDRMLPEVRGRAFAVAELEDLNCVRRINDALAKTPTGGDWKEARKTTSEELGDGIGSNRWAETIVQTNVFQAYSSERYRKQIADRDIMPYLVYHSVGDGIPILRTRLSMALSFRSTIHSGAHTIRRGILVSGPSGHPPGMRSTPSILPRRETKHTASPRGVYRIRPSAPPGPGPSGIAKLLAPNPMRLLSQTTQSTRISLENISA